MTSNSDEACCEELTLSTPSDARENSDSDMVASLEGGRSDSEAGTGEGERIESMFISSALLTKQQRVLMSSTSASVRISCGTPLALLDSGWFMPLRFTGGGMYVANRRRSARRWDVNREPANGVVRRWGNMGRAANICDTYFSLKKASRR